MSSIFGQRLKPNKKSEIVEEIGKGVTEWNENSSFYKNTVKNLGVYYPHNKILENQKKDQKS